MRLTWPLGAAAVALAVLCAPASASMVEARTLEQLVRDAGYVVLARVESQASRYDARGRIVTDVTLEIEQVVKGDAEPGARLVLRRFGGVVGDVAATVDGAPTFRDGELAVVFAQRRGGDHLYAVGMSQGVFPVRVVRSKARAGGATRVVDPSGRGLALVTRGPNGTLQKAAGVLSETTSLDAFLGRLRAIAAAQEGH
ncbi:MAG: hypothetical protein KC543_12610 [Myxococcales bacterium]|nr:hypothetical protein [Myxococcales bacterium]